MHFNLHCAACITPADVNEHGPWFNVGRLKSMPNTANNKQEPPNDTFVCYDAAVGTPCVICYACAENAEDYTIVPSSYDAIVKDVPAFMHELSGVETALVTLVFHVGTCISLKGEVASITAQLLPLQFHGCFTPAKLPLSYEELRLVLTITTELVDGFISTDEICVRRDKVQRALEWLTSHSEPYKNVHIDWERIANLPMANELPDIETYNVRPFVEREIPLGLKNSTVPLLNGDGIPGFSEACPTIFPNGVGRFTRGGNFIVSDLQQWALKRGTHFWCKVPAFAVMMVWLLEEFWNEEDTWITDENKRTMRQKLGVERVWQEFGCDEVHAAALLRYSRRNGFYVAADDVDYKE